MKLLRHGPRGHEKPGILDSKGKVRDLSALITDITPATLSPEGLAALRALDLNKLPIVEQGTLGVPWTGMTKFIAIGLNYADHAAESNMPIPKEPIVFTKTLECAVGANHDVVLPKGSKKADWEVELGVVIGSRARYVSVEDAPKFIAGYCVVNDVSEREYQLERGSQWDKGKGCDTFGPIGPWLVTADEVGDPQKLKMWLELNGKRYQNGSTKTMIFSAAQIVSYLSEFMTLNPGDLITTGTPPGVGMGVKPKPVFLKPGDVMKLGIEKLGEQQQAVYAWNQKRIDA
ncbi:fumarylacetoacetate hydrolase family protein [Piscinibacter sakaiensis]|uniref:fumarylacetoacetate hydrolase family protein n=1 Tax=Piscinibacter sakaiensis TaxID=1547922 RepID=UPI003AAFD5C2